MKLVTIHFCHHNFLTVIFCENDDVRMFIPHYITRVRIHLVIYRRHIIRVRVGRVYGYPSCTSIRGIINSGSSDVAIKTGIYPNAHAISRSREKRSVISNLSDT